MSNPPTKPPSAQAPARNPAHGGGKEHDDDILHVPQGVSRRTFYFLIGLLILLMLIWLVPGAISSIASGSKNPIAVRFRLANGEEVTWHGSDVMMRQRALQEALSVDPWLSILLGVDLSKKTEAKDMTRLLVLDRIAQESGVEVTDADLAGHLQALLRGQPIEAFQQEVRARGIEQLALEESIRGLLRVGRFLQLVGFAGGVPDPAKIEELWHRDNVEFAFEYATLDVAGLAEEARKQLPDDAGLQAWFDKLAENEKEGFKSPEKRKAELALYRDEETTPAAALLAAYPEKLPEGAPATAPDELASQYYNSVYATRFLKDASDAETRDGFSGFFSFEEVKQVCLAESGPFFALQRWIEDLNARRTNGETIDFAAEAQKLGLEHQAFPEAQTRDQFAAVEGLEKVADPIFATAPDGSVYAIPVGMSQGMAVVRVTERTEPEMPAFETIRDKVIEKWLGPKESELALARLKTLREGFERFDPPLDEDQQLPPGQKKPVHYRATAEAFKAALDGAGLALKTRDYLNKASRDKLPDDPEQKVLFAQASAFGLYALHADEVAAPGMSNDKKQAYLVRLAGKREVPLENMSPAQFESYKRNARSSAMADLGRAMDLDYLRKNNGLWLLEDERAAEAAAQEQQKKKG